MYWVACIPEAVMNFFDTAEKCQQFPGCKSLNLPSKFYFYNNKYVESSVWLIFTQGRPQEFLKGDFQFAIPPSLPVTFGRNIIVQSLRNKEISQTDIIKIKRNQSNELKTVCLKIGKPD